jgi:hypothetical protein
MQYFDDLQFKFELCKEIQKKDENAWNIVKLVKKPKIEHQTLIIVPLTHKKLNPKIKKN